jgi:hypothetical protein
MPYSSGHCSAEKLLKILFGVYLFGCEMKFVQASADVCGMTIQDTIAMTEAACHQFHQAECEAKEEFAEIQADEVAWGGRKYQRGKRTNKDGVTWYLTVAAIERTGPKKAHTKKVFSMKVDDRTATTLVPLIERKCSPTTRLYTDGWKAYGSVKRFVAEHLVLNHRKNSSRRRVCTRITSRAPTRFSSEA